MKSMPSKSLNKILILACKDYPNGNLALQDLKYFLSKNLNLNVQFKIWNELDLNCLNEKSLILPLAVWDYSLFYDEFLNFLEKAQNSGAFCLNPYKILKTNSNKNYLKKLQSLDLPIAKSLFLDEKSSNWLEKILKFKAKFKLDKLVLKPCVGQSGKNVLLFDENFSEEYLRKNYQKLLVQEFLEGVFEGEFCLVFFNKKFQYAVKRELKSGDFRANSAYGVQISSFKPCENLINLAQNALNALVAKNTICLYARIDLIKKRQDFNKNLKSNLAKNQNLKTYLNTDFIINEVELIEPSLYFDKDKNAYKIFAQSLKDILG